MSVLTTPRLKGRGLNPDPPEPELTVFELREGRYVAAAKTPGPFTADHPFTVTIAPARLVAGLRRLTRTPVWRFDREREARIRDETDLEWLAAQSSSGRWTTAPSPG